jgi:anti-anti-sigma factor
VPAALDLTFDAVHGVGSSLRVHATYDGIDRVVLRVAGEIDMATAEQFRTALTGAMGEGARQVVVDLERVDFLSSEGLGCLGGAARSAAAAGTTLYVTAPGRMVRRAIEVTGLAEALRLRADLADVPSPALEED